MLLLVVIIIVKCIQIDINDHKNILIFGECSLDSYVHNDIIMKYMYDIYYLNITEYVCYEKTGLMLWTVRENYFDVFTKMLNNSIIYDDDIFYEIGKYNRIKFVKSLSLSTMNIGTLLKSTSKYNSIELINWIIERIPLSIKIARDALLISAEYGNNDIFDILYTYDNYINDDIFYKLSLISARTGNSHIFNKLLMHKKSMRTHVIYETISNFNTDLLNVHSKINLNVLCLNNVLMHASKYRNLKGFRLLLNKIKPLNVSEYLLIYTVENGYEYFVKELLERELYTYMYFNDCKKIALERGFLNILYDLLKYELMKC